MGGKLQESTGGTGGLHESARTDSASGGSPLAARTLRRGQRGAAGSEFDGVPQFMAVIDSCSTVAIETQTK